MAEQKREKAQVTERQPVPAQAEGPDEEAGEGLEQFLAAAPPRDRDRCKKDKGGVVH